MKKRLDYLITLLGVILVGIGIYLIKTISEPQNIMKAFPYILIGLGCGALGQGLGNIFNKKALAKNPALAKQMEIETKDERNIMIINSAKAKAYDIMTYVFAGLILAYAMRGTSVAIVIPFVIAYLFVQGYALYYRIKIEKEQ